jgi:hypothetical protein
MPKIEGTINLLGRQIEDNSEAVARRGESRMDELKRLGIYESGS